MATQDPASYANSLRDIRDEGGGVPATRRSLGTAGFQRGMRDFEEDDLREVGGLAISEYPYKIYIRKLEARARLRLRNEEIEAIIFNHLGFVEEDVISYCQTDPRKLEVSTRVPLDPRRKIEGFEVRPGELMTEATEEARDIKTTWVHIYGAHTHASDHSIEELLAPFGKIVTAIQRFFPRFPDRGRLHKIWDGSRRVGMIIEHEIPNVAWIKTGDWTEDKVRLQHVGQERRCNHCGKTAEEGCKGETNFEKCMTLGGSTKVDMKSVYEVIRDRALRKVNYMDMVLKAYMKDETKRRIERATLGDTENVGTTEEEIFKNFNNFRVFPVIYEEVERRYYGRRVDRVRHEERLQEEEKKKSYNAEREEQRKAKEAKERWEQEENQRWVEAETRARESETIELYQLRMDGEAPEKEIKAWLVARMGEELKRCYVKKIEGSSRQ